MRIAPFFRRFPGIALATLVSLLAPARASADASTADRAIAEQLYDRGRSQMSAGQIGSACESFAESERLDPGTGTLLYLAACHEAEGKLASAWVEFREAAATLRRENRPDRSRYAHEHLAAIEPRLAYLTIAVPESAEGHAPVVTLDGRALGPAVWGVALPVDAGWHEAVADYGSGTPWRATIKISDGQRRHVAVPGRAAAAAGALVLDVDETKRAPAPPARLSIDTRLDGLVEQPSPAAGRFDRARVAGIVLGGAGIGALGVAGYSAWHASNLWSERNHACPREACTSEGVSLGSRASAAATVATWTTAGGIAALGVAAALVFWPRSHAGPVGKTTAGTGPPSWARWLSSVRLDGPSRFAIGGLF